VDNIGQKEIVKLNVKKIYILNFKSIGNFILEFAKLRNIIKKEKPNILHCFLRHSNIIGRFAAIGFQCKVIASIRVKLIEKPYFNFVDRITQQLVDIYTVNSNSLKKFIINYGIKKKPIVLIENGVDFNRFRISNNLEDIKKDLNLSDQKIIITMVAHLRKQKDYPTILRALSYLKKEIDFVFLSVGFGTKYEDDSEKIKKLTNKFDLKNVKFLGFRNDIPNILLITDIWVSSTLYEGQSNSLLEAMAMKKPIVTTDIPENAEVVRNNREAILVPIKSPLKMANSIKRLIYDEGLAKKLAINAYERVRRNYDINVTVKKLDRLYNSLVLN